MSEPLPPRQGCRGGAPVGLIEELPPEEALAIRLIRLWGDSAEGQAEVWNAFARSFGAQAGAERLKAFERFLSMLTGFARRPVMRHCPGCRCLGADEAVIANLLGAAAGQEHEDAALIATLLVRADIAIPLVRHAEAVGLAFRQLADRKDPPWPAPPLHHSVTRH